MLAGVRRPATLSLLLLLGSGTLGCEEPGPGRSSHAPPCPEGALDLPARTESIVSLLASVPEGAALIAATRDRMGRICVAQGGLNAIDDDRTIVLDRALDDAEAAARVGHLLVHVRDGSPYPERAARGADCDAIVARALDREASAHGVELSLRRALGVSRGRLVFPFEEAFWAAADRDREQIVRRWLEEHPDGAPGLDGLAAGYRARCERERTE